MPYSEPLFRFFNSFAYRSPFWDNFFIVGARYLTPALALSVVFVFIFSKKRSHWKRLAFVYIAALLCWLVAAGLKIAFSSPRPFERLGVNLLVKNPPADYAFPSGHTAFLAGLSLALASFDRPWGLLFLASTLFVGLSRVVAGLHWFLDIAAGLLLAVVVVGLLVKLTIKLSPNLLQN
jgi:membrane-associated phospholipid phosphatase